MANVKEIEAFLSELETEATENTNIRFINRDKLMAPIDEDSGYSDIFEGYILEGYTSGIEGKYGESTAVRMIEPENGRRMTLWLTGFEQEHLKNSIAKWTDDGASFPMEVKFLRHKVPSRNGRKYNRFSAQLLSSGDTVVVPPVPEDQFQAADSEESDN